MATERGGIDGVGFFIEGWGGIGDPGSAGIYPDGLIESWPENDDGISTERGL